MLPLLALPLDRLEHSPGTIVIRIRTPGATVKMFETRNVLEHGFPMRSSKLVAVSSLPLLTMTPVPTSHWSRSPPEINRLIPVRRLTVVPGRHSSGTLSKNSDVIESRRTVRRTRRPSHPSTFSISTQIGSTIQSELLEPLDCDDDGREIETDDTLDDSDTLDDETLLKLDDAEKLERLGPETEDSDAEDSDAELLELLELELELLELELELLELLKLLWK